MGLGLCLPFGAMWLDYIVAIANARTDAAGQGLGYVFADWPVALLLAAGASLREAVAQPTGLSPDPPKPAS